MRRRVTLSSPELGEGRIEVSGGATQHDNAEVSQPSSSPYPVGMHLLAPFLFLLLLSCSPTQPPSRPPPLEISRIELRAQPIEENKPLPTFTDHFEAGTKVVYAYVWFQNVQTQTGSFPVRVQWFHPNDLSPPLAMSEIKMTLPESIAQFSLHNDGGMEKGPYKVLFFGGTDYGATGSARFFVGMTREEAEASLREEEEVKRKMEEERGKKKGEDEKGG